MRRSRQRVLTVGVGVVLMFQTFAPSALLAAPDPVTTGTAADAAWTQSPRARTAAELRAEAVVFEVTNLARLAPSLVVPEAHEPPAALLEGWSDLRDLARTWSDRMARDGRLVHNTTYGQQLCCWSALGENVGVRALAPGQQIDDAARELAVQLLRSASHRTIALDPRFTEIGVGVTIAADRMYVTMDFRQRRAGTVTKGVSWQPGAGSSDRSIAAACPATVSAPGFRDVVPGPHAQPIACAAGWGIVQGRSPGRFDPGRPVTRAQVASILYRLLEAAGAKPETFDRTGFVDVRDGPHRAAIERLAGAGVLQGTSQGRFRPASPVRRDQLASMIVRSLDRVLDVQVPQGPGFADVAAGSTHDAAIRGLTGVGIAQGETSGHYRPAAAVRRDQMATFAIRTMNLLVRTGRAELPPDLR